MRIHFSVIVFLVATTAASAATYRYTSGPVTSISYSRGGPAVDYEFVGIPTATYFTIDLLDEVLPNAQSQRVDFVATFGQFEVSTANTGPQGRVSTDDSGNITDWQIGALDPFTGSGVDYFAIGSSPSSSTFTYRYEYAVDTSSRDCFPQCGTVTAGENITVRSSIPGTWERLSPTEVPLPAGSVLFLSGLAALGLFRRTKKGA